MIFPYSAIIPADCMSPTQYVRSNTAVNIHGYLIDVEEAFDLPPGTLSLRHLSGKVHKSYDGISLSEVRKAAIFHLRNLHPQLTLKDTGRFFGGIDHTSVIHAVNRAQEHLKTRDPKFLWHYEIVKKIVV